MSPFCDTNVTEPKKLTPAEALVIYLNQSYDFVIEMSFFIISTMSQFQMQCHIFVTQMCWGKKLTLDEAFEVYHDKDYNFAIEISSFSIITMS